MNDLRHLIKQTDPVTHAQSLTDGQSAAMARSILRRAVSHEPEQRVGSTRRRRSVATLAIGTAALFGGGVAVAGLLPADKVASAHLLAPPMIISGVGPQDITLPTPPHEARYLTFELACFDGTLCGSSAGSVEGPDDGDVKVDRGAVPTTSLHDPSNPQQVEPLTNNGLQVRVEEGTHWRLYAVFTDTYQPPSGTLPGGATLGLPGGESASDYLPATTSDGHQGWVRYDDLITEPDVDLTADGVRQAPVTVYADDGTTSIGTLNLDRR